MTIQEQVVASRLSGVTYSQIKEEYGVPKSTAQRWVAKYGSGFDRVELDDEPVAYVNENLQRVKPSRFQKTEVEVLGFLEELAPIYVSAPSINVDASFSDYTVVLSDMHFPKHCQKSLDVALETIRQLQPKHIILNGDTVDMLAVSRFPKDIRHQYSLLDERKAYHEFLGSLLSVSNGAIVTETHSNHAGNGTDGRWFRYLSERLGELASLPDIAEKLSYQNVFLGELQEFVNHADYVEICPLLIASHGDVVRKNGGYSARGMLDKYFHSMIVGHTHRLGMTAQRIPGIGSRPESQVYVWEMGCLCDLHPIYASAPNWQNGFGIVSTEGENFGVEMVMIQDGKANISTLGCTIAV